MKAMITFIGLLTVLGGLLPFFQSMGWLTDGLARIPTSGPMYQAIIVGIGVIALIYGVRKGKLR